MGDVRVGQGRSILERMAIEAQLERAGLQMDPKTRVLSPKAPQYWGAASGVASAAAATGKADVFDLGDFDALPPRLGLRGLSDFIAGVFGEHEATIRRAEITAATNALDAASEKFGLLVELRFPLDRTRAFAARIQKLELALAEATQKATLAFAKPEAVRDFERAMTSYLSLVSDGIGDDPEAFFARMKKRHFGDSVPEEDEASALEASANAIVRYNAAIRGFAPLFADHDPAEFGAPWTDQTHLVPPVSGRVVFDLERTDDEGATLKLFGSLDGPEKPDPLYADDILIIRYEGLDGELLAGVDSSTWRETSPPAVLTAEGLVAQDNVGMHTLRPDRLNIRAKAFSELPPELGNQLADRFAHLLPEDVKQALQNAGKGSAATQTIRAEGRPADQR